jgi:broad specificity phosphatase PhoE
MPVVLLVRHGQASFGAADYDELSDLGRRQCEVVGAELRPRALRAPSSCTARCGGSATPRRSRCRTSRRGSTAGGTSTTTSALLERYARPTRTPPPTSSRRCSACSTRALRAWCDDAGGGWDAFSGGRARDALRELLDGLPRGRDAVVVTSGGIIAAVCARLLGLGADGVVALNRVAVNAAVTTLASGASGTSLLSFNEHGHLAPA